MWLNISSVWNDHLLDWLELKEICGAMSQINLDQPAQLTTDPCSLLFLFFNQFAVANKKRKVKFFLLFRNNNIGPHLLCRPFCLVFTSFFEYTTAKYKKGLTIFTLKRLLTAAFLRNLVS